MNENINKSALFNGSCFALITTAFTFSIRAGILGTLGQDFGLTGEQLGFINSMFFFGFPISMILGGLLYYKIGPKLIMQVAFLTHTIGILTTIFATSYPVLLVSTLFIGFGNGCTEAACNPMIADMYPREKVDKMLNRFHMWFPGGIVLGSLISKFMTDGGMSWQAQMWVTMIPTVIYAILFFGKEFPKSKLQGATSIAENLKAMATPTFIFLFICMSLTAISEFGPQQWVGLIMSKSGASPMLILALVTGLMAVGRFFGGPITHALGQTGVLLGGAIFTAAGIYLFSTVTGSMAYIAAVFFAIGVCFFWPTMVGAVAKRVPLSGALGMSIIGGVGMFSTAIWQPIIGGWIDNDKVAAAAAGLTGDQLELVAGQATLSKMTAFPAILIVLFIIFFFWQKNSKPRAEVPVAAH